MKIVSQFDLKLFCSALNDAGSDLINDKYHIISGIILVVILAIILIIIIVIKIRAKDSSVLKVGSHHDHDPDIVSAARWRSPSRSLPRRRP